MENPERFEDTIKNILYVINIYRKEKSIYQHTIDKYLTIKIDTLPKILIFTL